ncbi:MAG TPA: hypothetical protein VGG22_15860 [Candidatus Baltobacteraceae bacterium]
MYTAVMRAVTTAAFIAFFLVARSAAQAHVICGDRVFPATLTMDDPGVGNEFSLPTIQHIPSPASQSTTIGYEWDKSITQDLGFAVNGDYIQQGNPGPAQNGWDNITITLKDELPCIDKHELAWSVGVVREIIGTGSKQLSGAGAIDTVSSTAPTFYVGKGLGDLKSDFWRPFAVTGEVSRIFSDSPLASPNAWAYSASLQYSMPYQMQHIKALNVPRWVGRLIPLVEFSMTNVDNGGPPTGTIAPGILYEANTWQVGVEALLPSNSTTRMQQGVGYVLQFHLFLDDFAYKDFFGKPIINKDLWGEKQ